MYVIKKLVKEINYLHPTALRVLGNEIYIPVAFLLFVLKTLSEERTVYTVFYVKSFAFLILFSS